MVSEFNQADIPEIIRLGEELNPKFKNLFHIESLSSMEKIYVYRKNGEVLGFLHVLFNLDVAEILNIVVNKDSREKGIGSLLLDYFFSGLDDSIRRVLLEVKESNVEAIKLYSKFNFMVVNYRKNYYETENAIVMERSNEW